MRNFLFSRFNLLRAAIGSMVVAVVFVTACGGGGNGPTTAPTATPLSTRAATSLPGATAQSTATPRPTTPPPATATSVPVPTGQVRFALSTFRSQEMIPGKATRFNLDPMYDYIVGAAASGELEGKSGLTTAWQMTPDGKQWTFQLRDTARWHTGDKVTSKDVSFSFEWAMREGSVVALARNMRLNIEAMNTPDDATITFRLRNPEIFFPYTYLAPVSDGTVGFVLPKAYLQSKGEDVANKNPVGSGPYKFKENEIGARMVYEAGADSHFYYGIPKYKTLTLTAVPEEGTRLAVLRNGDAEMIEVSRYGASQAAKAGMVVRSKADALTLYVRLHDQWLPNNPLSNVKVRNALDLAIDRQGLVDSFLLGQAVAMVNYLPGPLDPAFEKLPVPKQDLVTAKRLLEEAGYSGFTLNVVIHEIPNVPEGQEIMEAIATAWEKIGVKVKRSNIAYATVLDKWVKRTLEVPTVTGIPTLGNRTIDQTIGRFVQEDYTYRLGEDPEIKSLGTQMEKAASLEEYTRLGKQIGKLYAQRSIVPAIATVGQEYALKPGIGGENWNLGKGQNSIRILELLKR